MTWKASLTEQETKQWEKTQDPISQQNFSSNPLLQTALRSLANKGLCPFSGEAPENLGRKVGDKTPLHQNPDTAASETQELKTGAHYPSWEYNLTSPHCLSKDLI